MQLLQNNGKLWEELVKAIVDAFPNLAGLQQMVRFGLNENLNNLAGGARLRDVVFELISWAEAQGKTDELLVAARNQNPGNPKLRGFAEKVGLAALSLSAGEAERIVLKSVRFQNVEGWRQHMSQCELAVCRVELPNGGFGTGFLVGPNLVMTNHHVVESVIADPSLRGGVVLRFDYKTGPDGVTLRSGETYGLAADWLADSSPLAELDFALLHADGAPGEDPVGGQPGAPERGWLKPQAHVFEPGEPIFILQHPQATPLKFAAGSLSKVDAGRHRVIYTANTEPGASGSPCFTTEWDLVALHHWGDPTGNEGIILAAILARPKVKAALGSTDSGAAPATGSAEEVAPVGRATQPEPARPESPKAPPAAQPDRIAVRETLKKHFNLDDLRALCQDLNIEFESIAGETRDRKALELVAYAERHVMFDQLIAAIRRSRPNVTF